MLPNIIPRTAALEGDMKNPYHDVEIVVDADRHDWGKRWRVVSDDAEGCWLL